MKINIKNTADGLKLASCFEGCDFVSFPKFIGHDSITGSWVFSNGYRTTEDITIDLSTSQPCIYQCMKQGLRVEIDFFSHGVLRFDFSLMSEQVIVLEVLRQGDKIQSIKILGLEDMEGLITEGGEG